MSILKTISLIESLDCDLKVIVNDAEIKNLFEDIYPGRDISFLVDSPFPRRTSLLKDTLEFYKKRAEILDCIEKLSPVSVYFFHVGYCDFESWLILRLSSKCRVYYSPVVAKIESAYTLNIKSYVKNKLSALLFPASLDICSNGYNYYNAVGKKFLDLCNASVLKLQGAKVDAPLHKKLRVLSGLENDYDVLIFAGGEIGVDEIRYVNVYQKVVSMFCSAFGSGRVAVKYHPRYQPPSLVPFDGLDVIPKDIPGSIVIGPDSIVVSYGSAVLFEATQFGATPLSLLFTLGNVSDDRIDTLYSYLTSNSPNKSILYPQSIDELSCLLNDILPGQ
ncbi:hypothetical protein [Neptuniibacter halophilus]|uniref:hypothetical protein n=1 Tax=Neptuniibacter halophilus TaxID=651666 RepID=UPI0025733EDF|nr:hypothetical protein [Neptuniibacter halophilus]